MGFRSTSEQLSGKEISVRLFGSTATCGRIKLLRGNCYKWRWRQVPPYWHLSKVKLLPPQVSPARVPLVAQFCCSVKQVPPDPGEGWAALFQGLWDPPVLVAGPWRVQQDGSFARAARGTVLLLRKRGWSVSRGSLIRCLLFLNFCKSWSRLPGLKGCQAPCVWGRWERWLCCYGTGGVSKPHRSGSWAGSQQHVLIAAVQQQNKYSEISIKAVIKGASLAF